MSQPAPIPRVSLRRTLEQIVHCAREALSIIENGEHPQYALDDLEQASKLITGHAIPRVRAEIAKENALEAERQARRVATEIRRAKEQPCTALAAGRAGCKLISGHAGPCSGSTRDTVHGDDELAF